MKIIIELLKLAGVGIVASVFTSYIANRDHRQKKWWELRVAIYKETIEALSDLFDYFDSYYNAEITYSELSEEKKQELSKAWKEGYRKVRKSADSGSFLFSIEAEETLRVFIKNMGKDNETYFEYLDNGYGEVKQCLEQLVACSKKDLRLKTNII